MPIELQLNILSKVKNFSSYCVQVISWLKTSTGSGDGTCDRPTDDYQL